MKVAVLLPVVRPGPELGSLMRALTAQSRPPDAVWVAETCPREETARTVKALGGKFIAIAEGQFDHAGTRSLLARSAGADRLVLLSQDATLAQPDALEHLLAPLERGIAAAYGRQLAGPSPHPFTAFKRSFLYPETSREWGLVDRPRVGFDSVAFSNAFSAYRSDALRETGWFGERRLMCEDVSTAAALLLQGHRLAYIAEATVIHPQAHSLKQELQRYFDIGAVHAMDPRLQSEFGTPRLKGFRFTLQGIDYLRRGHPALIPKFTLWCALKWVTYGLGRHHARLPLRARASLSGLPDWWRRGSGPKPDRG